MTLNICFLDAAVYNAYMCVDMAEPTYCTGLLGSSNSTSISSEVSSDPGPICTQERLLLSSRPLEVPIKGG